MKFVRIAALITVIFLAGLYAAAVIAALSDSPNAGDWFKACIFLTVTVPVLLYGMALVGRYGANRNHLPEDDLPGNDPAGKEIPGSDVTEKEAPGAGTADDDAS